jgi:hypothetical protein
VWRVACGVLLLLLLSCKDRYACGVWRAAAAAAAVLQATRGVSDKAWSSVMMMMGWGWCWVCEQRRSGQAGVFGQQGTTGLGVTHGSSNLLCQHTKQYVCVAQCCGCKMPGMMLPWLPSDRNCPWRSGEEWLTGAWDSHQPPNTLHWLRLTPLLTCLSRAGRVPLGGGECWWFETTGRR